jgi:hypothetical protein
MPNSSKGGNKSNRGLASADEQTRKEVAKKGGEASAAVEADQRSGNSGGSSSGKGR